MSNILLISPSWEESFTPNHDNPDWVQAENDKTHYPMGIGYLHSYMEHQGHTVRTLFHNTHSVALCFKELKKAIAESMPDIVGVQMLTQNRVSGYQVIDYLHATHPGIRIVLGGIHATAMADQLATKYPFSTVVVGEGEFTFADLVKTWETGGPQEKVAGIVYMRDGAVHRGPDRELISNLDDLPDPKHDVFFSPGRHAACILTTRGCPFACSFCALDKISNRIYRKRSVERVIGEIETLRGKYPNLTTIWIHDDTFFLDNKRVIKLCEEIAARNDKWNLQFVASGRVKPISETMVQALVKANFTKLMFGLESGTDSILRDSHKNIKTTDVMNAIKLFENTGIECACFLIVGLPGETWETIKSTAQFVQSLQSVKYLYYNDIGILMIYPDTEVYHIAKAAGQINDDYWLSDKEVPFFTVEHSIDTLRAMKRELLTYISVRRLVTHKGLQRQWKMLPYIARYIWRERGIIADKIRRRVRGLVRKVIRVQKVVRSLLG